MKLDDGQMLISHARVLLQREGWNVTGGRYRFGMEIVATREVDDYEQVLYLDTDLVDEGYPKPFFYDYAYEWGYNVSLQEIADGCL